MRWLTISCLLLLGGALSAGCGGGGGPDTPTYEGPLDTIAFGAQDAQGNHGLYLLDPGAATIEARLLLGERGPVSNPRWSPNGTRLAYLAGEEPNVELRITDAEGGAAQGSGTATTVAEGGSISQAWSPDGDRLAYAADGALTIYDFEADSARLIEDLNVGPIDWSADNTIAAAGENSIFLIDPDGSGIDQTLDAANVSWLRWSPDGEQLAYASEGEVFVLTPGEEPVAFGAGLRPAWSPDGGRIVVEREAGDVPVTDLYIVTLEDGEAVQATQSITLDEQASWAPDGDTGDADGGPQGGPRGGRIAYVARADQSTSFLCVADAELLSGDCFSLEGLQPTSVAWSLR